MWFKRSEIQEEQWQTLNSIQQLEVLIDASFNEDIAIFKHSTRCSISSMAKSRIETRLEDYPHPMYLLDLIAYRDVSNAIAVRFQVQHESPQLILVRDGKAVYAASHSDISMDDLLKHSL